MTNTSITSGCKLRVCAYEELDPGNWVASGCTWNFIASGEPEYVGLRLWAECDLYDGTGRVRGFVRFDGSNVREVGPIRTIC